MQIAERDRQQRARSSVNQRANKVELCRGIKRHVEKDERYFEQHVAEFKRAAENAVMQYRQRIVEHQFVLERLANMAIELFARAATLSRTQKLIDDRGADACAHEISVCGMFCVESGRRFRGNRNALDEREEELDGHRRSIAATVRAAGGAVTPDPVLSE